MISRDQSSPYESLCFSTLAIYLGWTLRKNECCCANIYSILNDSGNKYCCMNKDLRDAARFDQTLRNWRDFLQEITIPSITRKFTWNRFSDIYFPMPTLNVIERQGASHRIAIRNIPTAVVVSRRAIRMWCGVVVILIVVIKRRIKFKFESNLLAARNSIKLRSKSFPVH